jgi:hypothetical protein
MTRERVYICSGQMQYFHLITRKMALKINLFLASSRRIQARCKDEIKVIVKFLRKGLYFQQTESGLSLE